MQAPSSFGSPLEIVMRDPLLRGRFLQFMQSTHAEENLLFWQDVQEFKTKNYNSNEEFRASSLRIFNKYLKEGSSLEVNVAGGIKSRVWENMKELTVHSFDPAETSIQCLLEMDSIPKFLRSCENSPTVNSPSQQTHPREKYGKSSQSKLKASLLKTLNRGLSRIKRMNG